MSRKTIEHIDCDLCGNAIKPYTHKSDIYHSTLTMEYHAVHGEDGYNQGSETRIYDLCAQCTKEITNFIKGINDETI